MDKTFFIIADSILIYFFLLGTWYLVSILYSFPKVIKTSQEVEVVNISELILHYLIPVTITIPTYNGAHRILNTLDSIFWNTYKNVEIIIVNDGSTDNTLELLIQEFDLFETVLVVRRLIKTCKIKRVFQSRKYAKLWVVDKVHGSYNNGADSNNTGLNIASSPLFMTLDDDTILESNALMLLVYSFLSRPNTIAVGGALRVLNENKIEEGRLLTSNMPKKFIPAIQALEYLRSFTYGRASLDVSMGGAMCFPGAFSLYETKTLRDIGGYDGHNPSYDAEIIIKIQHIMRHRKYPINVHFMSGSFAWTEVPKTLKSYWKQRSHWQFGMLKSIFPHLGMLFNPRYGFVGLVSFPAYIFFETLGPVIEFFSYLLLLYALFFTPFTGRFLLFFVLAWGYIVLTSILSYFLDFLTFNTYRHTNVLHNIMLLTLELFGFRQFRALCCTYGTCKFVVKEILKPLFNR